MADSGELRVQTGLFGSQVEEAEQAAEEIDFKMVTFSLAGKDYGIDIMSIAEIAKFDQFTYVPNTPPFVAGVYNLRGEIISVIDMRIMFNLPAPQRREGEPAEGLILRLDSGMIGVIVDSIAKVVGISSNSIQPPHPIFADINLKYISGVVEHEGSLYIILDVERILGESSEDETIGVTLEPAEREVEGEGEAPARAATATSDDGGIAVDFASQTLETLRGFHVTTLNKEWVTERVKQWADENGQNSQVSSEQEVDRFLRPFFSPYTGSFLSDKYIESLMKLMPEKLTGLINVWNPGCGRGYESYSLAVALRMKYPDARVKVWASDNDLLNVSSAPNLTFTADDAPAIFKDKVVEGSQGLTFAGDIKDSVVFEFSDILHENAVPTSDLIVLRDVLSFLSGRDQGRVLSMIREKCKENTVVLVGRNENLAAAGGFVEVAEGESRAFRVE